MFLRWNDWWRWSDIIIINLIIIITIVMVDIYQLGWVSCRSARHSHADASAHCLLEVVTQTPKHCNPGCFFASGSVWIIISFKSRIPLKLTGRGNLDLLDCLLNAGANPDLVFKSQPWWSSKQSLISPISLTSTVMILVKRKVENTKISLFWIPCQHL